MKQLLVVMSILFFATLPIQVLASSSRLEDRAVLVAAPASETTYECQQSNYFPIICMARNTATVWEYDNGPIDGYITVVVYYWKLNYKQLVINTVWVHTGTVDHHDLMMSYTCYQGCGDSSKDLRDNTYTRWTRGRYYCDSLPKNEWHLADHDEKGEQESWVTHERNHEFEVYFTNRNFGTFDCTGYRGEEYMVELLLT